MAVQNSALRDSTAAVAVALAFGALAPNANAAGLYSDNDAVNAYRPAISNALAQATGDDMARTRARGFMSEFEKALAEPHLKPYFVDYPKPVSSNMLRVIAVVPPTGFEHLNIPVCAEQFNKVVGTWDISPKGKVTPSPWAGQTVSDTPTSSACKHFIMASRAGMEKIMAEQNTTPPKGAPRRPGQLPRHRVMQRQVKKSSSPPAPVLQYNPFLLNLIGLFL